MINLDICSIRAGVVDLDLIKLYSTIIQCCAIIKTFEEFSLNSNRNSNSKYMSHNLETHDVFYDCLNIKRQNG